MESKEFDETKENIENLLRYSECDDSIKIDTIKCVPGSKEGDNYMSVVKRITVTGKQNNNQNGIFKRHLIVKRQIANLARRKLFRCEQAFNNEITAYCHVIPKLLQFASTINQPVPFVHCLFAGNDATGEIIILEDLKPLGYKMPNRLKGLDYNHCKLVLQELGKMHGVSLAAKRIYTNEFQQIIGYMKESIYCNDAADFYTHSLESSLHEALFSLRKSNANGELSQSIAKIEKLTGKLYSEMCRCVCENTGNWMVVCHGDLWINNFMFKYNHRNEVNGVKFVDLQTLRYTSPVIDILHFLYTSTDYATREQYMEQLLSDYVQSLHFTLQKFNVFDKDVETIEIIENTIKQEICIRSMYALGICMWLMPAVTFDPDNVLNLDSITMDDFLSENQEKTLTSMQTPEYHRRMKETVLEFFRKGILNQIL